MVRQPPGMTTSSSFGPDPLFVPRARDADAAALFLATSLDQLLRRDRERPPRWMTRSFAADVERTRLALRRAVSARDLEWSAPAAPLSFGAAVELLGRDAAAVALAVRRLEIARSAALPPWEDLVRRGVPPTTSPLEVATWFG